MDVVILAGGNNSRMKTDLPKFFLKLADKPMIRHIIDRYKLLGNYDVHVVTSRRYAKDALFSDVNVIIQPVANGTAGAVAVALPHLRDDTVIVQHSDVALISSETISQLVDCNADAVVTVASLPNDKLSVPYGRVFHDNGIFESIIEYKELNDEQKLCTTFNVGLYKFNVEQLKLMIREVKAHDGMTELFLPDVLQSFKNHNKVVKVLYDEFYEECVGINNMTELIQAEEILQKRITSNFIRNGVQILSPRTTYISAETQIGRNVIIEPNVVIKGSSVITDGVTVKSFSYINNEIIQ